MLGVNHVKLILWFVHKVHNLEVFNEFWLVPNKTSHVALNSESKLIFTELLDKTLLVIFDVVQILIMFIDQVNVFQALSMASYNIGLSHGFIFKLFEKLYHENTTFDPFNLKLWIPFWSNNVPVR